MRILPLKNLDTLGLDSTYYYTGDTAITTYLKLTAAKSLNLTNDKFLLPVIILNLSIDENKPVIAVNDSNAEANIYYNEGYVNSVNIRPENIGIFYQLENTHWNTNDNVGWSALIMSLETALTSGISRGPILPINPDTNLHQLVGHPSIEDGLYMRDNSGNWMI